MTTDQPPPVEAPPARDRRVLVRRAGSAVGVTAMLFAALVLDMRMATGWWFAAFVALGSWAALAEFWRLARARGMAPFAWLGFVAAVAWPLATEYWCLEHWHNVAPLDLPWAWEPLSIVMGLAAIGPLLLQLARRSTDGAIANVGVTMLGILYCGALPSFFVKIRHLSWPASGHGWAVDGVEAAALTVVLVKGMDVGALLVGRVWGKRKLIPRLSPGKTIEGAVGGALFSVFLACLLVTVYPSMGFASLGYGSIVALALLLSVASLLGDLVESAFKRDSGVKDAGASVPGFGGVLDLLDSLIVGVPAMYMLMLFFGAERAAVPA